MAHANCLKCEKRFYWKAKKGAKLHNFRCPFCKGELKAGQPFYPLEETDAEAI